MSVILDDLRGLWKVLQPVKCQYALLIFQVFLIGATFGLTFFPLGFVGGPDEEDEFYVESYMISHSHIFAYGITKAISNLFAGLLSDKYGRKIPHIAGWVIGLITPLMIIFANNWNTVIASMLFLGFQQALCWSTDLFMMIDYAGISHRGIAVGLNETIGYCAIAIFNLIAALLMDVDEDGYFRTYPYYVCIGLMCLGLILSFIIKDTLDYMIKLEKEQQSQLKHVQIDCEESEKQNIIKDNENNDDTTQSKNGNGEDLDLDTCSKDDEKQSISQFDVFLDASFLQSRLLACSQAGLMINFIVGLAWTFLVKWMKQSFDPTTISGTLLGFGLIRGLSQFFTGYAGDLWGRKWLIFTGLVLNGVILLIFSVAISALDDNDDAKLSLFTVGAIVMGFGIGLAYPNLLAVVAEETDPNIRATALGTYRLWRDMGYAIGVIISGALIDATGSFDIAVGIVCGVTFVSALLFLVLYNKDYKRDRKKDYTKTTSQVELIK